MTNTLNGRFSSLGRRLVDTDRSSLYMARIEQLIEHDYPPEVTAHWMTPAEMQVLADIEDSDVSHASVAEVACGRARCSGVFVDGAPAAYVLVVAGDMTPVSNSGGYYFSGIGARLPPGVLYMYKLYTLPNFRGRKLIARAIHHGAHQFDKGRAHPILAHTAFTTTASANPAANRALKKMGMTLRCELIEQVLLGKFHRYDHPVDLPVANPDDPSDMRDGHLQFYV